MNWKTQSCRVWSTFMLILLAAQLALAQLDTLYFDDFVDNRHNWNLWNNEKGLSEIEDGYLNIVLRQRNGHYNLRTFSLEITDPDTFVYEIGMRAENIRFAGPVYEYGLNKTGKMLGYNAFGVTKKDAYSYSYTAAPNRIYFGWRCKDPLLYQQNLVFRVAYGNGSYHFFLNDRHLKTIKTGPRPLWKYWGWVVKGYALLKIDYLLLKG